MPDHDPDTSSTSRRTSSPLPKRATPLSRMVLLTASLALCMLAGVLAALLGTSAGAQVPADDSAEGIAGTVVGEPGISDFSVTFSASSTGTMLQGGCESATGTITYTDTATGNTATATVTNLTVFTFFGPGGLSVSAELSGPITSTTPPSGFTSNSELFEAGQILAVRGIDQGTPGAGVDSLGVITRPPAFNNGQCIGVGIVYTIDAGEIVVTNVIEPADLTRTAVAAEQTAAAAAQQTATAAARTATAAVIEQTASAVAATQTASAIAATTTAQAIATQTADAFNITATAIAQGPADREQCMNGGWKVYGFKNQGECLAFLAKKKND